jgi:phenylacetate-CoA ligase
MVPPPHTAEVWDERELWSRERLAEHQLERLRAQLAYVAEHSAFYRERFAAAGFEPGDLRELSDLEALAPAAKPDYARSLAAAPPFGTLLAADSQDVVRVHFSSGTAGSPTPIGWTAADLERWADLYARSAYAQGVRRGDVYQCLFSFAWFVGGLGAVAGYQRLGATCIPGGSGDSERQVRTLFAFGTTAVGGTPSFVSHLAEVAASMGLDLRDSAVERVMVGGEPAPPATRAQIEEAWGARCYDGYGALEFQPIAWECSERSGPHLAEDFLYAEVVDRESGRAVADGEPGVLVLTHLDKQACPLVRWWTGDVVVRDPQPCACGRTHARLRGGVRGRADDMLVVRGVNVFPSAVEEVVRAGAGPAEFQIVLDEGLRDRAGFLTAIKLRVETEPEPAARLAAAIRERLGVRAIVDAVPAGTLPRSTHKARRVVAEAGA